MIYRLIIFLILNFGALAIGGYFSRFGVSSNWYMELTKAPWTPPGWMFGVAWTTIMLCFSIYLAYLYAESPKKTILFLFIFQWILNVAWNLVFFYNQNILGGLFIIIVLTILIGCFLILYWPEMKIKSFLIVPYFLWMLIASSLNIYIAIFNR